jgi:Tfp pilus assembly protein PilN
VSVRVNLLPRETYARQAAARQRLLAGVAGLLLIVILAGVYVFQLQRVSDAEAELAAEQARVDELQAEVAALAEFEELQRRHEEILDVIAQTLAGEATVAGVLQDLAAVMPTDAQLDSVSLTLGQESTDSTTRAPTVGDLSMNGKSLESHAPGVERFLISLGKVASFVDLHVSSSSLEGDQEDPDDRTVSFNVDGQIGPEVLTGRYDDGLPEELR